MKRANSQNDDGDENARQQPYLSGAYIRSFVKQLASSRSMREKTVNLERETADDEEEEDPHPPQQQQQQQKKKQVRRRVQTRKPYQEKLLNMAEARREIVTALKLHRAAMKEQQQQQIQSSPDNFQTELQKSRRNPRIYAENNIGPSPYNFSSWPNPAAAPPPPPPPPFLESLDFALPSQALGLNLNLHDFITAPLSIYSSSSPSTSSSPPPPPPHAAEEIRGEGGERFEFLNCGEIRGEEEREEEMASSSSPFDEVMEFPAWLNANESCLQQNFVDDFCSVLPCMDIEEIEGMDGDWLA